ncbi:type III secretion system export apparatus subunit SctT [Actimicrobium antarcticum]|uniref:Type III secretion protein T n=1 Tax=Actimicrobium antarcticum TaxID=1051899 RepID=A0ABP7SUM7_9BURK
MSSSFLLDLQHMMVAMALIMPRSFVVLAILPGFGTRTLVGIARNSIAIAIALPAWLPTFYFVKQGHIDGVMMAALGFKEAAIGLILGVLMAIPIWVVQSLGSVLDTQRAATQVMSDSASFDADASALGAMLLQAVVMVMIQAGLMTAMVRVMIESYGLWPAFSLSPPFELGHMDVVIQRFGEFFWHLVVYGGPVLIPLVLIDFTIAVIGIFASNLQVSSISSPIKCLAGLFILLVYWPTLAHYVAYDFSRILDLLPLLLQATAKGS